jgi:hypothetical protein
MEISMPEKGQQHKRSSLFSYEHRSEPVLHRALFVQRLTQHFGIGMVVVALSLAVGTAGFIAFSHLKTLDAFVMASMLLGGMGPVGNLGGTSGKIFGSVFSLYSGLVFLILAGLLLAPVFHRMLHKFHWETHHNQ